VHFGKVFDIQGLNWWVIASGIGMNFVLTLALLLATTVFVTAETNEIVSALSVSVGAFLIPFLTAYVCARVADERYLTYAFYPLIGFLVLAVPGIFYAGMFGLLVIGFGILGAINGATLVARRKIRRRREIYGPEDEGGKEEAA
jgi:hypothetical protein